jgi:hypothetical protein
LGTANSSLSLRLFPKVSDKYGRLLLQLRGFCGRSLTPFMSIEPFTCATFEKQQNMQTRGRVCIPVDKIHGSYAPRNHSRLVRPFAQVVAN